MADPKKSVLRSLPVEERSPFSPVVGEVTPAMNNAIGQMKAFKGSREEAEVFLGEMIKALIIQALIPPPR